MLGCFLSTAFILFFSYWLFLLGLWWIIPVLWALLTWVHWHQFDAFRNIKLSLVLNPHLGFLLQMEPTATKSTPLSLSSQPVFKEIVVMHLWQSPFFCTLLLKDVHSNKKAPRPFIANKYNRQVSLLLRQMLHRLGFKKGKPTYLVVCWRNQMQATQWRHLQIALRNLQIRGR